MNKLEKMIEIKKKKSEANMKKWGRQAKRKKILETTELINWIALPK